MPIAILDTFQVKNLYNLGVIAKWTEMYTKKANWLFFINGSTSTCIYNSAWNCILKNQLLQSIYVTIVFCSVFLPLCISRMLTSWTIIQNTLLGILVYSISFYGRVMEKFMLNIPTYDFPFSRFMSILWQKNSYDWVQTLRMKREA